MEVLLELKGLTPLVMHNIRLADAEDEITKKIKELTATPYSKRTDSENLSIAKLEFLGGLYYDRDVGVYVPTANIVKCFEEAAKVTRQGKNIVRAVALLTDKVKLEHEGPNTPEELWERLENRFRVQVGVGRNKIPRMRPIFRQWGLSFECELAEDIMNPQTFQDVATKAGRIESLCDARKLGQGRFTVEVQY